MDPENKDFENKDRKNKEQGHKEERKILTLCSKNPCSP
ncbi:hypothetical protein SAMN05421821_10915 [Mucilaginibacter lappiensis]|uniref:Uncharacterized protein n=1 Tax=Mucilaginibacter lappiensis TaxID=354630 RepID=A0A1N7C6R9_9SPHI|nr:hypothetical protein [Mucilaginibacter lappiensis]MBB6127988.1 hypothetical protein [Mucilaginibacter lappiensis]SIR59295.1 hypothetical protein SAMN05421821_10915 [Mucilaginibacter lappiensis]